MSEKNFLLKVFKSHECVKGLVKPSENHSLFEALNCKEDLVDKEKSIEKSGDTVVSTSLNLEEVSRAGGSTITKHLSNQDTDTNDCAETSFQISKDTLVTERQLNHSASLQEDTDISEDNLVEDESDRVHDKSSVTEHGDDCSETSDDTDSPILKLLKNTGDNSRDTEDSDNCLIKDNVDNT